MKTLTAPLLLFALLTGCPNDAGDGRCRHEVTRIWGSDTHACSHPDHRMSTEARQVGGCSHQAVYLICTCPNTGDF